MTDYQKPTAHTACQEKICHAFYLYRKYLMGYIFRFIIIRFSSSKEIKEKTQSKLDFRNQISRPAGQVVLILLLNIDNFNFPFVFCALTNN